METRFRGRKADFRRPANEFRAVCAQDLQMVQREGQAWEKRDRMARKCAMA